MAGLSGIDGLVIDGVKYSAAQLKNEVAPALIASGEEWKADIGKFILQWIGSSPIFLVNTSGSTGIPKQIAVKRSAMIASALKTIRFFNVCAGSSALMCLPARYIAGRMMLVRAFVGGWNITFRNPAALNIGSGEKFDFAAMVPLQADRLIDSGFDFNNIGTLILGGASTPVRMANVLQRFNVWETYGMTETVSHVALRKCGDDWFTPLDGVRLSTDGRGCLVIDAPDVAETTLVTNDVVELMEDGRFLFVGRADNIVNSGGIKLFPEKIEKKLNSVIDQPFAVTGLPDDLLGQKLVLVVASHTNDASLKDRIAPLLDKYENPKEIIYIPQLFYTSNNKIDRVALRLYLSGL
jgi:O-succinylbenzoic acid--CoA ligase